MKCTNDADLKQVKDPHRCRREIPGKNIKGKFKGVYATIVCTRPKDHAGPHHAHNWQQECVATFTDEEAIIEAL